MVFSVFVLVGKVLNSKTLHFFQAGMLCTFTAVLAGNVRAQTTVQQLAPGKGAGPRVGKIVVLELTAPDRASAERLAQLGYDIESLGRTVRLYADSQEQQQLAALEWPMSEQEPVAVAKDLGTYNGYAEMTAMLDGYATNYPALCRKMTIGQSVLGRELWAMKITSNPDQAQDKPKFKYISTIHGNEPVGTEMCLYFMDLLLKGYGSNDPRIVNLLNNVEIWILPLVNPDGRESNPPQRYNANGYDLNRSFPEGSGTDMGNALYGPAMSTAGLQPEVRAMMNFTAAHTFCMGANFHSGSLIVNYPYDNDGLGSVFSPSPDELLFQVMSRAYSSNNAPMWANNDYTQHFTNGIVNGADWYAVAGGLQDWSYRFEGIMDTTIELANNAFYPDPPANQLPTYWSQNKESMLAYMEWCLRGVRGVLTDAETGLPVRGAMRVEGHHHLVFSDATIGDYHRQLLPGTYNLWFYAPGYIAQRITNVVVTSSAATRVNVVLQPVSSRFAAKINFQPLSAPVPTGFVVDTGTVYGSRGSSFTYGWETTLSAANVVERRAGRSQDPRYDTFVQMQAGGSHAWEIAVPNGPYSVLIGAGDPSFANGFYQIAAENVVLINGSPPAADQWLEGVGTVVVTDGRLTLSSGPGAISNRIDFVEISALEPTTIAQWRALYFGTTNNSGNAADMADPDNDGLMNLLEYAVGQNPLAPDPAPGTTAAIVEAQGSEWLDVSFSRNVNATDLRWDIQAADSLTAGGWSTVASYMRPNGWSGAASVLETNLGAGRVQVSVRDPQAIGGGTARFYRVLVTFTGGN